MVRKTPTLPPKKKTWRHVKDIPADTLARDLKEFLDKAPASTSPEPTAEPVDASNVPTEGAAPYVQPNVTMAGFTRVVEGYRVTMAFHAPAAGPCMLVLGSVEARLLARSLMEWAQYCDDQECGRRP